jgi:hypothetical protein
MLSHPSCIIRWPFLFHFIAVLHWVTRTSFIVTFLPVAAIAAAEAAGLSW